MKSVRQQGIRALLMKTLITFIGFLIASHTAFTASFDCRKANTDVERMVCKDSKLSEFDVLISNDYEAMLRRVAEEYERFGVKEQTNAVNKVKASQREWLRDRNKCEELKCVRASYETRRYQLNPTEGFTCLEKRDGDVILPASGQTSPHLTVTWFQFVDDLTFKFTGIPIHSNVEPNSEGCEDTDSSILVYKTKDDTPLFYRTGNIRGEVIPHEQLLTNEHPAYKKLGQLTKASNLILRYDYLGNCGGCFSAVIFSKEPSLKVVAEYYFDPDKYGDTGGPVLKRYNNSKDKIAIYKLD